MTLISEFWPRGHNGKGCLYFSHFFQVDEAPYGDATKGWMLTHIAQLRNVLYDNEDVIITVQAGFIGIWGNFFFHYKVVI